MKFSLIIAALLQACLLLSSNTVVVVHSLSSIPYPGVSTAPRGPQQQQKPQQEDGTTTTTDSLQKLAWKQEGYQSWDWNGKNINYIEMGDSSKPALLLIHGFGASAYHFRYNIPELAKDYHVFAFDMLGFGLSDKPLQEYPAEVWKDQTIDFMKQVIQKPVTLAGNSLGGFTALYAAAECAEAAHTNDPSTKVNGCILMNSAGEFRMDEQKDTTRHSFEAPQWLQRVQESVQKFVINTSFIYTKQPARIEQVLKQVYPANSDMVDADLVASIQFPSLHPNAASVFLSVISQASKRTTYVDDLLQDIECPILLCWGKDDPWIRPQVADKIQLVKPQGVQRVTIDAGHCPHDEAPAAVNAAIVDFMEQHQYAAVVV
jgi:pimeloyl-ACP methyl ester carboxylesterase